MYVSIRHGITASRIIEPGDDFLQLYLYLGVQEAI
jgi:hypothetical protein